MKIHIKSIPHKSHRYSTVGDYWGSLNNLQLRVSNMPNWRYEAMITIHELIERFLNEHYGVKTSIIDKFDKEMEKNRLKYGKGKFYVHFQAGEYVPCYTIQGKINEDEPGICPKAPYYKQHDIATMVEKLLCKEFGIKWQVYDKFIANLG